MNGGLLVMKKLFRLLIGLLICTVLILSIFNISVLAENESTEIKVLVNGEKIEFDVQPFMENDSVMVPFRQIAEAMGIIVEWDDETSTIIGCLPKLNDDGSKEKHEYITIKINDGEPFVQASGEAKYKDKTMNIAVTVKNDRTCIPVRFFAEALDAEVDWDEDTNTVFVSIKTSLFFDNEYYKEFSLLNKRLYINLPNDYSNVAPINRIYEDCINKTTIKSQQVKIDWLTINAEELFVVSSGNLKDDVKYLGYSSIGEIKTKDKIELIEYEESLDAKSNVYDKTICSYLIKNDENKLITLRFSTNKYSLQLNGKEKYMSLIEPMVDSLKVGERKISNLSHTEYFGFGDRNKITIKDWYALYFENGYTNITKIVNVQDIEKRPFFKVCSDSENNDDSYYPDVANCELIDQKEGLFYGKKIKWDIYSDGTMYAESKHDSDDNYTRLYAYAETEYDQKCIIDMLKSIKENVDYNCSGANSAKPVIYLYPETEIKVDVKLDISGEFTFTYPKYNNGWSVIAKPDGTIICDEKEYSYLFWEGIMPNFKPDFKEGFVVKGSDSAEFLRNILSEMGLTPREYNEFIVYWAPKLQENEYNKIYFAGEEYENEAKLSITPKPDSILRVYMVYEKADEKTVLPPQKIKSFERDGFTVVEWGGRLIEE